MSPAGRRVLVSAELLRRCHVPEELEVEDMGKRELRGKVEALPEGGTAGTGRWRTGRHDPETVIRLLLR